MNRAMIRPTEGARRAAIEYDKVLLAEIAPAPKKPPPTPDERIEEFMLWANAAEDRRLPEGAWLPIAIVLGALLWVPIILGLAYLARAVL